MNKLFASSFAMVLIVFISSCGIEKDNGFRPFDNPHPFANYPFADAKQLDSTAHVHWLETNGYNVKMCETCHGSDLNGKATAVSCATCHHDEVGKNTAMYCNHCHGEGSGTAFSNPLSWAPPRPLYHATYADSMRGIGRHQFHMTTTEGFLLPITCTGCHIVPEKWDASTHLDGKIEMNPNLQYDPVTKTCVTCHGRSDHAWDRQ